MLASRTAGACVVREHEERGAEGAEAAVHGEAVEDRAHAVLADAEVERAPAESPRQHQPPGAFSWLTAAPGTFSCPDVVVDGARSAEPPTNSTAAGR